MTIRTRSLTGIAIALAVVTIDALQGGANVAGRADPVDDFITAEMERQRLPGLALAVVEAGKTVKAQGYGLADVERATPVTPDTVFKIGSVSKQFIATGIMVLAQDGRLGLDDPVSKHLHATPATWSGITIRHLLTHTSGIVREGPAFRPNGTQTDAEVVTSAYPLPLRFAPGTKWEYCNVGYFALAEIISRVSGLPWPDFMHAKVFQPLGMTATRPTSAQDPKRAVGYTGDDKRSVAPDWSAVRPSGAFQSTILDLAKWEHALTSNQVLTEESRRLMWTPVILADGSPHPYGFGWELHKVAGRPQIGHGGSLPGFRATYVRFPDDRLTVIVLVNADDVDRNALVAGLAARLLAVPAVAMRRPAA
jgi:CubicO group peptidase (beta-lactamase class C family)